MVAFTYRMPAGIAGEVTRFNTYGCTIKQEVQNLSTPVTVYGVPVIVDANGARPITASDSTDIAIGFSARPFPGTDVNIGSWPQGTVPFGAGTPPARGIIDILERGYISVKLGGSVAAAKGGAVSIWYAASTGAHVQGQVEASATGGSTYLMPRAVFQGPADADGNVEIAFNI